MAVHLNHTIVHAHDSARSSAFLAGMLGLADPEPFGPFLAVRTANDVTLDFIDHDGPIVSQHYAFLITEEEFDEVYGRIVEQGLDHWADPGRRRAGEINRNDGGRGVYFCDPDGHLLEVITRPYGSG
jgi:catechol 2,3-dioxygenase-like lactoylglutathione lyase family enzyme